MTALRELGGDAPVGAGLPVAGTSAAADRAAARGRLGDRAAEADLLARLAVLATHRLAFTEALEHGHGAVALEQAAGPTTLLTGLDGLKTAYAYLGEVGAPEVVEELEPLARRTGDLLRLHWVVFPSALVAVAAADWAGAAGRIDEALRLNARSGYSAHEVWLRAHLGWVARLRGDHGTALDEGRHAVALAGRPGPVVGAVGPRPARDPLLECGEPAEAVELLTGAADLTRHDGMQAHRLRCLGPLAEATGDPAVLAEADALLRGVDTPAGSAWLRDGRLRNGGSCLARCGCAGPGPGGHVAPLLAVAARTGWIPTLAAAGIEDGRVTARLGDAAAARSCWTGPWSWRGRTACPRWRRPPGRTIAEELGERFAVTQQRRNRGAAEVTTLAGPASPTKTEQTMTGPAVPAEPTPQMDPDRLDALLGRVIGDLGATTTAGCVVVEHRLGLYGPRAGHRRPDELAGRTGTDPRYVAEWLAGQAAGGYVEYDPATGAFHLTPEQAFALADPAGPSTCRVPSCSPSARCAPSRGSPRPSAPAPGWAGTSTTTTCSLAASCCSAPATPRTCVLAARARRCRGQAARAAGSPTSAAGWVHRRYCSRRPSRGRPCRRRTTTRTPSGSPASGSPRRASRTG